MAADQPAPAAGLDEIRAVMPDLPGPDLEAATGALTRRAQLERTSGALGRLGDHVEWLATWQGRHPPSLRRPRTAVFAGNHGIARHFPEAGQTASAEMLVESAVAGNAPVNAACTLADADLRVFEMSLETPTQDASVEPAMDEEECARAIAYGMMSVEQGLDLMCLDTVGAGTEVTAAALNLALFGGSAADWLAGSPGADGGNDEAKVSTIARMAELHRDSGDSFEALRRLGGFEMCAVVGAVIASRLARTPVILGGYATLAAAGVLFASDRRALAHCRAAQVPTSGTGQCRLIELLQLECLIDTGSGLGAGTEAMLAVPMLKAAVDIHVGTAPALR